MNLFNDGNEIVAMIKSSTFFPFKSGNLKWHATGGRMVTDRTYQIRFDGSVAPYIQYLEEGTNPHDIPGAFGRPLPFGYGGRFDGYFHPGSTKHAGFISRKAIEAILSYYKFKYNAEVKTRQGDTL